MRAKRRIVDAPDQALVSVSRSNDGHRGLVRRKPSELERCAKEPHGVLRAAELVREIARPREPQRAKPRIGGQPGRPLQRGERDVEAAADPRPICRSIERRGDLLVRPLCGRRPVPDRPVRIAGQRPGERGVRQPALLAGCRLMDRRPDQRVPEPELAVVERSEAGRGGHRPVAGVEPRSEELFGRAAQLGELAVIEGREQQQRSHVGVESGEPRRERRLEPGRQRQRLPGPGQVEIDRCGRAARSGPADCRPPPRGSAPSAPRTGRPRSRSRSVRDASSSSPARARSGRPASSSSLGTPSRTAKSRITGSISSRRATNASTSADDRSSQCASSTTSSSGVCASRSVTTPRVARPIRKTIGRVALGDAERHVEGPALRIRTVIHPVEERKQQLMKPAEGQPRLGLRPRRRHHRRAVLARSLPGRLEQRRLADARLATDDEGTPTRPQSDRSCRRGAPAPDRARGAAAGRALRPSDQHRQHPCPSSRSRRRRPSHR